MTSLSRINQTVSPATSVLTKRTLSASDEPQADTSTTVGASADNPYVLTDNHWVDWTKTTPPDFISYQGNTYKIDASSSKAKGNALIALRSGGLRYTAINKLPMGQNHMRIQFNGGTKQTESQPPSPTEPNQPTPAPQVAAQPSASQTAQPTARSGLGYSTQMPLFPQYDKGLNQPNIPQTSLLNGDGSANGASMPTNPFDYLYLAMNLLNLVIQSLSGSGSSQSASPYPQADTLPQACPTPQAYPPQAVCQTPQPCPTPAVTPPACPPVSVTPGSYSPPAPTPTTPVTPPAPTPPTVTTEHGINISLSSPLVMDLGGDGIQTTSLNKIIDIDGDGKQDLSSWFGSNDGVLAFDANHNGRIDPTGQELFGDNSDVNGDGKPDHFANGFEALRALANKYLGSASTADNKLDASEIMALQNKAGLQLIVGNKTEKPSDAGISQINLGYQSSNAKDAYGNEFRQQGSFQRRLANGQTTTSQLDDVWLTHTPLQQNLA